MSDDYGSSVIGAIRHSALQFNFDDIFVIFKVLHVVLWWLLVLAHPF